MYVRAVIEAPTDPTAVGSPICAAQAGWQQCCEAAHTHSVYRHTAAAAHSTGIHKPRGTAPTLPIYAALRAALPCGGVDVVITAAPIQVHNAP